MPLNFTGSLNSFFFGNMIFSQRNNSKPVQNVAETLNGFVPNEIRYDFKILFVSRSIFNPGKSVSGDHWSPERQSSVQMPFD